jgi:broad specificity phosphatase PhoE
LKIVLARHGRPDFVQREWIAPSALRDWIRNLNSADVVSEDVPPITLRRAGESAVLVCSSLKRSVMSADMLRSPTMRVSEDIFAEADLPYPAWRFPRLPVGLWAVVFRVAWFLGYSRNAESFGLARDRARRCALRLVELADQHQSVFLVGHGIMATLIAKQLRLLGWSGPKRPSSRYWGFAAYTHL